ncbi:MarR family winged helix-turn-helix transcriptional regulator [Streptococcus caprae]|uniref:MarR family winged helix-turn-helix transcriptional regulator n=1 Tax=Streptococcus caprae TaxID=1640501 RepID=A0ABV8CTX1_9STRE
METIGRLIQRASHQLSRNFDRFAKPYGLTGTQVAIIDFLSRGEKDLYLQRDIEQEFHIQRSTTTVLLQGMEKKGLITRQTLASDARQRSVHLTEKSKSLAQDCLQYFAAEEARLQSRFTAQERDHFQAILHFIIQGGTNDNPTRDGL